jgi:hypothetical protein
MLAVDNDYSPACATPDDLRLWTPVLSGFPYLGCPLVPLLPFSSDIAQYQLGWLRLRWQIVAATAIDSSIEYFVHLCSGILVLSCLRFPPWYSWRCSYSVAAREGVDDKGSVLALMGRRRSRQRRHGEIRRKTPIQVRICQSSFCFYCDNSGSWFLGDAEHLFAGMRILSEVCIVESASGLDGMVETTKFLLPSRCSASSAVWVIQVLVPSLRYNL